MKQCERCDTYVKSGSCLLKDGRGNYLCQSCYDRVLRIESGRSGGGDE